MQLTVGNHQSNFNFATGDRVVRYWLLLSNFLLTALAAYLNPAVNDDGALYLMQAKAFEEGFGAALDVYNWPFYALCVFVVQKISTFPYEVSAYVLNGVLYVLLLDYLYRLARLVIPDGRYRVWIALTLLCFTPINDHRDHIVRDPGYWAFLAAGIYYFCLSIEFMGKKSVLGWHLCMIVAVLFRVEGVFVYVLLPVLMLVFPRYREQAVRHVISFKVVPVGLVLLVASLIFSGIADSASFKKLAQITLTISKFFQAFQSHTVALSEHVLSRFSAENAGLIYAGGMAVYLLVTVIKGVGYPYIVMISCALSSRRTEPVNQTFLALLCVTFISLLVLYLTAIYSSFTQTRYVVPVLFLLLLVCMPWLVIFLNKVYSRRGWVLCLFALILFYSLGDAFVSTRASKVNWPELGREIVSLIPAGAGLGSNNHKLCYYTQCSGVSDVGNYEYMVMKYRVGEYDLAALEEAGAKEIYVYELNRGKKVVLFRNNLEARLAE